jgi:hypothetical protein
MTEARLCPKWGKMNLRRYDAQTMKVIRHGVERLKETTWWKCVTPGCKYRETEFSIEDSPS